MWNRWMAVGEAGATRAFPRKKGEFLGLPVRHLEHLFRPTLSICASESCRPPLEPAKTAFRSGPTISFFRHTTGNPVWGHADFLHMMWRSPFETYCDYATSHSDGVSRHRFVTRHAEQ
jgi:hypothetical protein